MRTKQRRQNRPTLNVRFRAGSPEEFIYRYGEDIDGEEMFLPTSEPLAIGTRLTVRAQLQNGNELFYGCATVTFVRHAAGGRPGMRVRFDQFSTAGTDLMQAVRLRGSSVEPVAQADEAEEDAATVSRLIDVADYFEETTATTQVKGWQHSGLYT